MNTILHKLIHKQLVSASEFININFDPGELVHGERYMVCIHTVYTEIKHEMWTQVLPELNICSDGIMVDLTPPTPGQVWIGNVQGTNFQVRCLVS